MNIVKLVYLCGDWLMLYMPEHAFDFLIVQFSKSPKMWAQFAGNFQVAFYECY